jgi:hypothetical protein
LTFSFEGLLYTQILFSASSIAINASASSCLGISEVVDV